MAFEDPRRREFAELVTDHVFLHEHLDELVPVMDFERVSDELRDDRARPTPGLERLLGAALVEHPHAVEQLLIDERAFFCASTHISFYLLPTAFCLPPTP